MISVEDLQRLLDIARRSVEQLTQLRAQLTRPQCDAGLGPADPHAAQQSADDLTWVEAQCAAWREEVSPAEVLALWRVADQHPVVEAGVVRLAHLLRRRQALAGALTGWRAWLVELGARVRRVVWRNGRLSWSPWTGLAPPPRPATIPRQ